MAPGGEVLTGMILKSIQQDAVFAGTPRMSGDDPVPTISQSVSV